VACDICEQEHGVPGFSTALAREYAKRDGWVRKDGKDICPDCCLTPHEPDLGEGIKNKSETK